MMALHRRMSISIISSHLITTILYRILRINSSGNQNNPMPYEVRKVQDSSNLILVSIPKRFSRWMQIKKGSLVKVQFDSDEQLGNRVIVSKIYLDNDNEDSSSRSSSSRSSSNSLLKIQSDNLL